MCIRDSNELENLCLLLPQQDRLVLRGKYCSETDWGWQQLDVEIPLQAADPQPQTVLTDTYGSASVQLDGDTRTVTIKRTPRPSHGTRITASGWNRTAPTPSLASTMSMWMCASEKSAHPSTRWSIC